ncbi:hypothetical protein LXL04_013905 [Taraxacum kok-saghyz]
MFAKVLNWEDRCGDFELRSGVVSLGRFNTWDDELASELLLSFSNPMIVYEFTRIKTHVSLVSESIDIFLHMRYFIISDEHLDCTARYHALRHHVDVEVTTAWNTVPPLISKHDEIKQLPQAMEMVLEPAHKSEEIILDYHIKNLPCSIR